MRAGCGHGGHGVPLVEHFILGQAVAAQMEQVNHAGLAQVGDLVDEVGEVVVRDHGEHAGHLEGLAGIDRLDAGVRVRAAEDLAVREVG